ncbi:UNVERIFIED_CONTAM: hypothetical protein Scaly_1764100 [Sesamum calycinum]|uniref:Steroid 5-alpha reductase C-terminal domain-containing protein n=1 Tax=Sesamum calycinum TaxID=2727403 RepID=A0AAW2NXZ7_9LAMI
MASLSSKTHGNNLRNAVVALLAPLPSIFFYLSFLRHYSTAEADSLSPLWAWCYSHPLLLANILFFLNVNLLFWLVGLLQSSHWMIDLYWTVIPVLLVHYFATHPLAEYNAWRSSLVIFLTWVWSVRLTHSYFRREKWQFGAREDWRFSDMRLQYGKNWWWASFFAVYLSQQVIALFHMGFPDGYMLASLRCPLKRQAIEHLGFFALVCLTGVTIVFDTQLHNFVSRNEKLKQLGEALVPNLDEGLWHYSRHPNYFGEQLWWWGLVIFAWNLEYGRMFIGALINSLCLAYVSEELKQQYRAENTRTTRKNSCGGLWGLGELKDAASEMHCVKI